MRQFSRFTCALFLSCIAGIVILDAGLLADPAFAQRGNDDEGGSDRGRDGDGERRGPGGFRGRGDWGGRRRGPRGEGGGGDRESRDRRPENSERDRRGEDLGSDGPDLNEWARKVVKEADKNNNMMIDGDELRGLSGRTAAADRNGDKAITVDELVANAGDRGGGNRGRGDRDAERNRGAGDEKTASAGSAAATSTRVYLGSVAGTRSTDKVEKKDSDKREADKRRTYRFTPAADRLPTGLPSWFKSRDRNNDGQVSMSEYTRSWSQRMASEFRRYDRNDDGVVTPKEADSE